MLWRPDLASERVFIISVISVVAIMVAATWGWAVKGKMWFLDPEYPMWVASMQMLDACDVGETAIIGDSRAKAGLIPSMISDKTVNLSVGGASPIETSRAVESILKCPTVPKRVLLSFSPAYLTDVQVYWERTAPFNYLNFDQLEEVRKASIQLNDPMLYSTSSIHKVFDKIQNYSYWINFPSHYFPAMVNAGFITRKARNSFELDKTVLDRGHHFFGTEAESNWYSEEALASDFKPPRLVDFYFEKFISALDNRGIKIYFVGAPMNETTFQKMDPNFEKEFIMYIDNIRARHSNFEILGNPLPHLPNNNFGDSEHLNSRGAVTFSASVAKLLANASVRERDVSRLQ